MAGTIQLSSDATEADILQALDDLESGGTIILPENRTISIPSGLHIDVASRNITIDLNGSTLRKAGDVSVITARGEQHEAVSVKLGDDDAGNTVATYAGLPSGLAAGDWVKIISDDKLPGDHVEGDLPSRMGQAMEVLRVQGNAVTFKGALIDQSKYDTNIRASTYDSGKLVIKDGEIVGDQKRTAWNDPLLQLRSLMDAQVENVTVRDGVGRGIGLVDCVLTEITDVTTKNLMDGGSAALGIGVSSASSIGTTVTGLYAQNVTHAADNNAMGVKANSGYIERYGGDIGMDVSNSIAVSTRDFAWSWHSEALNGTFDKVMAFDCYGFLMARGIGGQMRDSGGAGNDRGIILYEYGDQDGRNISIDGVTLRETLKYSVFGANEPRNNTISNSFFEAYGPGLLASLEQVVTSATNFLVSDDNPNDILAGTAGQDMLLGGKGADQISGGNGNDYLWGGASDDSLTGGYGRDRFAFLSLGEGSDVINDFQGGNGGDILDLSALAARYGWEAGDPVGEGYLRFAESGTGVRVQVDRDGGGDDYATIATLENVHAYEIGSGNLRLSLSDATGPGPSPAPAPAPTPSPAPSPDPETTLHGTSSSDILRGDMVISHIIGGGGDDLLSASVGDTLLEGGAGDDVMSGNRGQDVLKGGAGADWMSGGDGPDRLYGEAGNDTLMGGDGTNMLAGGGGYDTANYAGATIGVIADIQSPGSNTGGAQGDRYTSIENLTGGNFNDMLRGSKISNTLDGGAGDDKLSGRAGTDTLSGGDGNDWLDGGAWKDVLTGGNGADSFYFGHLAQAGDTITDFRAGVDQILLSRTGFGLEHGEGVAFVAGVEAISADATILWDQGGGQLMWDADGTGGQDAVVLANLTLPARFSEADIWIA
jgi:Ca2+-binding RTX toxin-like protein